MNYGVGTVVAIPTEAIKKRLVADGRPCAFCAGKSCLGCAESVLESRFSKPSESTFPRLETGQKITIYSMTCRWRDCARRNVSFMAQMTQSAPHIAQLIRDVREGLT